MDEFYSEEFFDCDGYDSASSWTERDWLLYLKKSEDEIAKFSATYALGKSKNLSLDEIANMAGWSLAEGNDDERVSEFAYEPWTIFNHPVFITANALLKCMREHLKRVIKESPQIDASLAWDIASEIASVSASAELAINSTDLGEDTLARCNYKMTARKLNELLALVGKMDYTNTPENAERMRRIGNIILELRQVCLDLSEKSRQKKYNT